MKNILISTNVSSVRRQLSHMSQPKLAAMVSDERTAVVIVPDAAEASWCASNVTFDSRWPAELAS